VSELISEKDLCSFIAYRNDSFAVNLDLLKFCELHIISINYPCFVLYDAVKSLNLLLLHFIYSLYVIYLINFLVQHLLEICNFIHKLKI